MRPCSTSASATLTVGTRGSGLAVAHDAFVVHFQSKLAFHLLGEVDVDGLMVIRRFHVVIANGRSGDAQDIDALGQTQGERQKGAGLER